MSNPGSKGLWPELNPIIRKGFRERLRPKQMIAWGLCTLIVTSFLYLTTYLNTTESIGNQFFGATKADGAKKAFPVLLGIQVFILMFLGTGRLAAGTAEERETGLLDYQRMTPMRPSAKIVGYLFGLPAREYFMFALTLPFLVHAIIVGELAVSKVLLLYIVFLSCVLLYHLTAHVTGLIVSKPRAAAWVSRVVVLGLYVLLPILGRAGFSFLSFLTLRPTYYGTMQEELEKSWEDRMLQEQWDNSERYEYSQRMAEFWKEVPFFEIELSASLFTILMQGLLFAALFATAHRKWQSENLPAFSKTFGIGLFAVIQFFLLGSLWQLYGNGEASRLLGWGISRVDNRQFVENPLVVLIIVQTILFTFSLVVAALILHVTCPTRHQYLKGRRRAAKLGLPDIPFAADEKPGWMVVLCLALIMPITHFLLLAHAASSRIYFMRTPEIEAFVLPCLLFAMCLVYLRAAREKWFTVGFWGFLGLLWITPLLVAMVMAAGWRDDAVFAVFHVGSLSPPFAFFEIAVFTQEPHLLADVGLGKSKLLQCTMFGLVVAGFIAILMSISQYRLRQRWNEREKRVETKEEGKANEA
tara:strand:- start:287 stop:2038 length:1752 start_codon:yes stop_codon:yes gene_type:complete